MHKTKYWFKVIHSSNIIVKCVFINTLNQCKKGVKNWAYKVKGIFDEFGFSEVWNCPELYDPKEFINIFKQRVIDVFKQKWFSDIVNNNVLNTLYRHIKDNFSIECYLDKIKCIKTTINPSQNICP